MSVEIPLKNIDEPGHVVREIIDPMKITELAESISSIGLLQPILLRKKGKRYEIIAGHRRYLAHVQLGKKTIPSLVVSADDLGVAVMRATENLRRADLSPIEEGRIYLDLVENHGMTLDEIGEKMGVSAGVIRRRLDLVSMPPQLQAALHERKISVGVAEELWRISDMGALDYYLGYAVEHGVTVAVARQWVKDWRDEVRRAQREENPAEIPESPFAERPVFCACDLCQGPVQVGHEKILRVCSACVKEISKVIA